MEDKMRQPKDVADSLREAITVLLILGSKNEVVAGFVRVAVAGIYER